MFNMLRGWISRAKGDSTGTPESRAVPGSVFEEIVLVAPAYDELTTLLCSWLEKIAQEERVACKRIFRETAEAGALDETLDLAERRRVLLVFYGHGTEEALLTARFNADSSARGLEGHFNEEILSHVDVGSKHSLAVVAYCCLSAKVLGAKVRRVTKGGRYLGYIGEIPFELDPQCRDAFKAPMERILKGLIGGRQEIDDQARADLLEAYYEEWREWTFGEYSEHERAIWVAMCLEEHMSRLSREV